jgi:NADH dehydrogenase [ubiquinone] 1 alpha subcomplex assembly factor 1
VFFAHCAAVAWNIDDLRPPREITLFKFSSEDDLKKWKVFSDSEHGGMYLRAQLLF